jgi:hypothetical protein
VMHPQMVHKMNNNTPSVKTVAEELQTLHIVYESVLGTRQAGLSGG